LYAEKNFDGLKVLDFTRVREHPYLTMMLCDMGAEVIKIERPEIGSGERDFAPYPEEESAFQSGCYMMVNRGKKSVALDLKSEAVKEIMHELVEWADVVVENFAAGAMDKLGFGYSVLKKIKPNIIMLTIPAFGQEGPLSHERGFDIIAQAAGGLMWMTDFTDSPPARTGTSIEAVNASSHALGALAAALFYRHRTGRGQHINIATMAETDTPILERVTLPDTPVRFSETSTVNAVATPLIGAQIEEALSNVLYFPAGQIQKFKDDNAF